MFTAYGADHSRLRRLVQPAFTARRIRDLRPGIEGIVKSLLDDLAAAPPGEPVDLRARYAYPLPIRVICELMGVPEELRAGLGRCADGFFDTTITPAQAQAVAAEMQDLIAELIARKRAEPGEDLVSRLLAGRDEAGGGPLSEQELVDTCVLVISAGYETTVNLLDQSITTALARPDQLALVASGRVGWADFIEETLRVEAPVASLPLRYAVQDIDIAREAEAETEAGAHADAHADPRTDAAAGAVIRAGEAILAVYDAAGRDPRVHGATAEEFDATRPDKDHLAFGYGVHLCLGAPLARLEAEIALPALFARFPHLALAVPPDRLTPLASFISNGHQSLPAHLDGR